MTTRTFRCVVCGEAVVPASGRVCPLHLPASEQQILAEQASRPSAWVLAGQHEEALGPAMPEWEHPPTLRLSKARAEPSGLVLASFSERFVAFAIDVVAATMIAVFLTPLTSGSPLAPSVIGLGSWWGYLLLSNSLGQLVGKATLGIKVIDPATGCQPGFGKGAVRTVGITLNLLFTFGFGFLMMIGDSRKMTMHDHLAGTLVIRKTGAAG